MPEGPEIRRAADRLAAALAGIQTTGVSFAFPHLQPYEARLSGQPVAAVTSRSKAMLIRFADKTTIYSHNQLYGRWYVRDPHDYPDTNRQLRLAIHNPRHSALLYSASEIEVLDPGEVDTHAYLSRLGPELLDPDLTVEQVAARFQDDRFRRRQLSTLLLDQGFLAGMGNYLRSEVLFVAGVHPTQRPVDCTAAQIQQLAHAALALTRQSYESGGITADLALARQLKADGVPRRSYRFWVFGRAHEPCRVCQTLIVRAQIGGRRCYTCPRCQPG